jgi:hypothetical protein
MGAGAGFIPTVGKRRQRLKEISVTGGCPAQSLVSVGPLD